MLLTEEQARTKWCPQSRVATTIEHLNSQGVGTANRGARTGIPYESCHCIASECMAWRWALTDMVKRRVYKGTRGAELLMKARFTEHRGETFFKFDGAFWRYEYSSSDSKGEYDLIVRSRDEGDEPYTGFCGLAGTVEG